MASKDDEMRLTVSWDKNGLCPCTSGINYSECCAGIDGFPAPKKYNLTPPNEITGIVNNNCFLSLDQNCSERISREHYISEAVLKQFDGLWIEGAPWLKKGEQKNYTTKALASKILCERHNSALSSLDEIAKMSFSNLREANAYATKKTLSKKTKYFIVDGHGLELWALKTMLGLYNAKIFQSENRRISSDYDFNYKKIYKSFLAGRFEPPLGLHIGTEVGKFVKNRIGFHPLLNEEYKIISGMIINIFGTYFYFIFDTLGLAQNRLISNSNYRPWVIDIMGGKHKSRIILPWNKGATSPRRMAVQLAK